MSVFDRIYASCCSVSETADVSCISPSHHELYIVISEFTYLIDKGSDVYSVQHKICFALVFDDSIDAISM